jgi:hypothetical protein
MLTPSSNDLPLRRNQEDLFMSLKHIYAERLLAYLAYLPLKILI